MVVVAPAPSVSGGQSERLLVTALAARWGLGKPTKKFSGKPAVGTSFSFASELAVRFTFAFGRTEQGRKDASRCVARTHGNARRPICARRVSAGSMVVSESAGANHVRFNRVVRSAKLAPGAYVVTVTAAPAGGGSQTKVGTLKFTIAK
jgi:hypothetical protein